jgi:aminoglycoside phosphotransferase (APT) family kinase protein
MDATDAMDVTDLTDADGEEGHLEPELTARDVAALLRRQRVREALPVGLGDEPEVRGPLGRQGTFAAVGQGGTYVLRFPGDAHGLARLRIEARVTTGLLGRVSPRIPNTRVFEPGNGVPPFALHEMIPGRDWFQVGVTRLTGEASSRLARDLAGFMRGTHCVPIETAAEWLGVDTRDARWRTALAARDGRPSWFAGEALQTIRRRLASSLPADLLCHLADTAARYDRVEVSPDELVFVHGDLHGGNLAFDADEVGPRLVGVFDFENAGIMDYHYDFGRLNLVYDALQDQVLDEYARLEPARPLDRDRVETCARAFVFYLLAEHVGDDGRVAPDRAGGFDHLVRLLREHLAYRDSTADVPHQSIARGGQAMPRSRL